MEGSAGTGANIGTTAITVGSVLKTMTEKNRSGRWGVSGWEFQVGLGKPLLYVIITFSVWSCQRFTAIEPSAV